MIAIDKIYLQHFSGNIWARYCQYLEKKVPARWNILKIDWRLINVGILVMLWVFFIVFGCKIWDPKILPMAWAMQKKWPIWGMLVA